MRRRRVGDGRNRRRVSISKSDAKDLDTRGTNRCRLRDGCGIAPKLRTLSPIREQEKHLGSYAPATARPEHGQPGCEAAAYGGPALCVLRVGEGRERRAGVLGQVGQDDRLLIELDEPHARRALAKVKLEDELSHPFEHRGLPNAHAPRMIENQHEIDR
jgi:hypothetical protein